MKTLNIEDRDHIDQIINSLETCFLAVIDTDGFPYSVPMNFGYDKEYIYLHGANFGMLIDAIKVNPNACITFCTDPKLAYQNKDVACSYRVRAKSVIARGEIEFIVDYNKKIDAFNVTMANYTDHKFSYNSPAVKNVEVYRMKADKLTAKEFGAAHEHKFNWQEERDNRLAKGEEKDYL